MKRRKFIKNVAYATGASLSAPYILPSGRLFAATGSRIANHVIFVLFAGGIRNQESVDQQFISNQAGFSAEGNLMENMLSGAKPSTAGSFYSPWDPILSNPLAEQGTLFKEMRYNIGPTGHYNAHAVAMTGKYMTTGLNLNVNPEFPTIFELYRKHNSPTNSALNAWWISEALGPYPSLNYSRYDGYGVNYGANYIQPSTVFADLGGYFANAESYQPDDVQRINTVKQFLDNNFDQVAEEIPGIKNTAEDRQLIKQFLVDTINGVVDGSVDLAIPPDVPLSSLNGDLINITTAWQILKTFQPELMVVNTTNLDVCHSNFSGYLNFLHQADWGIGWLWDKIQSNPDLRDDTILICMPEHGRNLESNGITDNQNGFVAYDHTSDENSRRLFSLIVGPGNVQSGQTLGSQGEPVGQSVDIVPTIAHILGFHDSIPSYLLDGRILTEAFI